MTTENPLSKTFLDSAEAMGVNRNDFNAAVQSSLDGSFHSTVDRLDVSPGGLLHGLGTETSDSIPAVAPIGTFFLNAEVVRRIGTDRLDSLVHLARTVTQACWLSRDEYVVPPYAVAALGRAFWHSLNDAGNLLRDGDSPDPEMHQAFLVQFVDDAIAQLIEIRDNPKGDVATSIAQASCAENSTTVPDAENGICMAGGGMLGIALGAGAQEWARQRQYDRLDKADARADRADARLERADTREEKSAAQVAALNGIKLTKATQEQQDEAAVRDHIRAWGEGRKKIQAGDFSEVTNGIADYNAQSEPFNNGHTFAYEKTPEGPSLNHIGPDGSVLTRIPMKQENALKLYDLGMTEKLRYLSPDKFEEAIKATTASAKDAAERQNKKEVAQIYADGRMYGAEVGADATVEAAHLRAQWARQSKGLTVPQQRTNESIIAARRQLTGMTQDDILAKTQSHTGTGRENPAYDPSLARTVKLAQGRLYGDDPAHDAFNDARSQTGNPKPAQTASVTKAAGTPIERARAAMVADPNMAGHTLGDQTPQGFKVLDANGRHVGFYGRAR